MRHARASPMRQHKQGASAWGRLKETGNPQRFIDCYADRLCAHLAFHRHLIMMERANS
jgi:hypothetical protein